MLRVSGAYGNGAQKDIIPKAFMAQPKQLEPLAEIII